MHLAASRVVLLVVYLVLYLAVHLAASRVDPMAAYLVLMMADL